MVSPGLDVIYCLVSCQLTLSPPVRVFLYCPFVFFSLCQLLCLDSLPRFVACIQSLPTQIPNKLVFKINMHNKMRAFLHMQISVVYSTRCCKRSLTPGNTVLSPQFSAFLNTKPRSDPLQCHNDYESHVLQRSEIRNYLCGSQFK
jgi:hypothetical protein